MRRVATIMATIAALLALAASADAADSVQLSPGDDVQAVVDAHPRGTTYAFGAGTYRMQSIVPKDGDIFDGRGVAVLNGSRLLSDFSRSGSLWVASDQTFEARLVPGRICQSGYPRCTRPEDLYIDDRPMRHVDRLSDVGPGKWFFDYAAHKVYLGDDPTGRKVEIGVTARAFGGRGRDVTIKGFTVEKYAAHLSTIDAEYGSAWVIENNLVRLNHATGVNAGSNSRILRNRLLLNGQEGFEGSGRGFLFEENEIADNNYAGVSFEWEAGGGKVTETQDAVFRRNCVHDNDGPGIWADEGVRGLLIEGNVVFGNSANGIMYEISYDGIIRNNIVADNGKAASYWFWGPQILIAGSSNVAVYGNDIDVSERFGNAITIVAQDRRPYPPPSGNRIYDNTIVMRGADARVGAVTDFAAYSIALAANNSMGGNRYHVAAPAAAAWHWNGKDLDWDGIKREGQEKESTLDTVLPQKRDLSCAFLSAP